MNTHLVSLRTRLYPESSHRFHPITKTKPNLKAGQPPTAIGSGEVTLDCV
jgi:hypothetical protein